ncbi:hypothetical protein OZX65_06215 [Leuconostocaceae bacterium ESL0723]|nr:hypothetical protein [Lactobacillaceae bacterium L1_55_11]WEV54319.1 hypothetical protein OZX65_06215 [Leuconostocaceae bacterium ESL0723]
MSETQDIRDVQVNRQLDDVHQELSRLDLSLRQIGRSDQDLRTLNLKFRYLMNRLEESWADDQEFGDWLAELDARVGRALNNKHRQLAQTQEHLLVKEHNLSQQAQRLKDD